MSLFSCMLNKDARIVEKYFSCDVITLLVFRILDPNSQIAIIKNLSTNQKNLNIKESSMVKLMDKLRSLRILNQVNDLFVLNNTFKMTLSKCLSKGPAYPFIAVQGCMVQEIEEDRWTRIYHYILKDVSEETPKGLSKHIIDILNKESLVINAGEFEEIDTDSSDKSPGFSFLVQSVQVQVNLFIRHFVEYFFRLNFNRNKNRFEEIYFVEMISCLSLLPPDMWFKLHPDFNLPPAIVDDVFTSLDSIGLINYDRDKGIINVSSFFHNFLDPQKPDIPLYKTNIIVENDFRLYAYNSMDYIKYFLSKLISFVFRNQDHSP